MKRSGRSSLSLHFLNNWDIAPNVLNSGRRPLVGDIRHRRGRGDRKDRANLVDAISDMGDGRIAIHSGARAHQMSPAARGANLRGPTPALSATMSIA